MNNISLILRHEYITRVTKKSFIIMTLLGPLLIGLFYGSIAAISYFEISTAKMQQVDIYDPYNSLDGQITNSHIYEFHFVNDTVQARRDLIDEKISALLDVKNSKGDSMNLVAKKSLSITDKQALKEKLANQYFSHKLKARGLSENMLDSMRQKITLTDQLLSGKSSGTEMKSGIGYIAAFIIYIFIFMYGVMIMRGVTEEKNNRIVEIIISAVKPFELMMGKILGVALVGLTQFVAWIVLSGLLTVVVSFALGADHIDAAALKDAHQQIQQVKQSGAAAIMGDIVQQMQSLNFFKIIFGFIVFFFGGFLLYSSIFAAIGSAVDSDTETQQFMFPVSMPLIFGLVIAQIAVINDPNSNLAVWSSMIPFTSPVVMMIRIPFDVSWMEIILSAVILFGTFIIIVWMAGKIYRLGILSYGKKASYKQMVKWLLAKE